MMVEVRKSVVFYVSAIFGLLLLLSAAALCSLLMA